MTLTVFTVDLNDFDLNDHALTVLMVDLDDVYLKDHDVALLQRMHRMVHESTSV